MKTSAITLGRADVAVVMACYAIFLGSWAWLLGPQLARTPWLLALVLAGLQALWHFTLIRGRTRDGCFRAFALNHWLGFTVFLGVAGGYALR
jgi:4-hydroxybenzoate polyprenyltransferase